MRLRQLRRLGLGPRVAVALAATTAPPVAASITSRRRRRQSTVALPLSPEAATPAPEQEEAIATTGTTHTHLIHYSKPNQFSNNTPPPQKKKQTFRPSFLVGAFLHKESTIVMAFRQYFFSIHL